MRAILQKTLDIDYPERSIQKSCSRLLGMMLVFAFCFTATLGLDMSVSGVAHAQTKSLKLYFTHTKERAKITFKKNGRYDKAGLKKLNRFLRDWRQNEPTNMDPRLFDVLWETYRQSGAKNYIHVVSAYRSPKTNEMLRKTRGGQAKKSQHMVGRAIDFYIPGVKISKLRAIGMKLQGGGVGYYPRSASPFVHLDVGSVRAWPRMSRKELVKLFPNGKTLHLPTDGKPLPGYRTALAEYKRRKGKVVTPKIVTKPKSTPVLVAKANTNAASSKNTKKETTQSRGLIASLFGRSNKNNEREVTPVAPSGNERVEVAALPTVAQNLAKLPKENIPLPILLNAGTSVPAAILEDNQVETENPVLNKEPELGVPENGIPETTIIASNVPTPVLDQTSVASLSGANLELSDEADAAVEALAYQEPSERVALPSLSAIIAAAIETDKRRKMNGEIPAPVVAGLLPAKEPKRIDIASLELPQLREHNRLSRVALSQAIADAAASPNDVSTSKKGRPNLRDALVAKYKSRAATPDLEQIKISKVAMSPESIVTMKPPAREARFVNRFMRKPPKTVYANGFSKTNNTQLIQKSFAGSAVNFLPVVKYNG